jgi:seryl-tRNA synthetase
MRYTKEQYREQYKILPPIIRDFMESEETANKILRIGEKYNLHIDQLNILNEEVASILYGLEKISNFHSNLQKYLGVSEDIANLITYDLNQQIFSKIREELQKAPAQVIANNADSPSPQQNFDQKMSGVSNVPKQEVEVKTETGDNKGEEANSKPPRDPYREPIT